MNLETMLDSELMNSSLCDISDIEPPKVKYCDYSKSRDERNAKLYREIRDIEVTLKKINTSIKNSLNYVDNNILPKITAVIHINEYRLSKC